MKEKEQNIQLKLLGDTYPISIPAQQEEAFRKAAKMLEEKVLYLEKHFRVKGREHSLTMVAIEIIAQMLWEADKEEQNKGKILQQIDKINQLLAL